MDTSRVDGVKAPQHRGTPRSYNGEGHPRVIRERVSDEDSRRVPVAPQQSECRGDEGRQEDDGQRVVLVLIVLELDCGHR